MVSRQLLSPGNVFDVFIIYEGDYSQVANFIDTLQPPDIAQFAHRLEVLNTVGIPHNEEQFRNEGDEIFALKTKNSRFYGFFNGPKVFVLAVGFKKGSGRKVERRHHSRALLLRSELSLEEGNK